MGWVRVWQDGHKLTPSDSLVAGKIVLECCCIGMIDDPSQGGFKGKYIFDFDMFVGDGVQKETLASLIASIWIKDPGEEWPVER